MEQAENHWKKCSSCKQWIDFESDYWTCNVSTCNRKRTGMVFCTVTCWETHLPLMNHREAWAEDQRAPSRARFLAEEKKEKEAAPTRRIVRPEASSSRASSSAAHNSTAATPLSDDVTKEILIVASRLKAYVLARAGMNTSEKVLSGLSDIVRKACDEAIENARRQERKTVLDRDIPKPS